MNTPNFEKAISFKEKSIGTIYITGGGLVREPFTGVGIDSKFGWQEMVWKTKPSRDGSFAFSNMDDIDVGLIARCEINIKYMDIDKYMKLRKAIARERYFWVEFFDVDECEWRERHMYCSENTTSKFHILKQHLIGHLDYAIKFVGTNNDLKDEDINLTINYYSKSGSLLETQTATWGQQIRTADDSIVSQQSGKTLYWKRYNSDNKEIGKYCPNQSTTIWKSMNLYESWE